MSGYILSVDADFDLDDIWEHIATDNIDAADHWVEKLFVPLKPSDNRLAWDTVART